MKTVLPMTAVELRRMDAAIKHCIAGIGIWEWASNDKGGEPDVVMACTSDVPTLEILAAVEFLRKHFPKLRVRVINVMDLMKLQPQSEHLHVRGSKEEGTTSTPFDRVVMNDLDRFHLVADVIDRVPRLGPRAAYVKQAIRDKLIEHKQYIAKHGEDLPEIRNWKWGATK